VSPRSSVGPDAGSVLVAGPAVVGEFMNYPIPSSSGDSRGVPQRRQITAEQSPQVSGSLTSRAQLGQ